MTLKPVGSNQTEVSFKNGVVILFSYQTPVAAFVPGKGGLADNHKYSVTTSRHINEAFKRWGCSRTNVTHEEIAKLAESSK